VSIVPEIVWMLLQANKEDAEQPLIADILDLYTPGNGAADVCVVGCGPSGLALAAELASNGLKVALVGEPTLPHPTPPSPHNPPHPHQKLLR
jgi:D-arabinose 5-phosphate isomerase GutQ